MTGELGGMSPDDSTGKHVSKDNFVHDKCKVVTTE